MNTPGENPVPRLPVELERRVDHVCRQFEAAWRLGHRPSIEEYLGTAQGSLRELMLGELLGLELELRQADGERPTVWQYRVRFPQYAQLIQQFFSELGHSGGGSTRNSVTWKSGGDATGNRRGDRLTATANPAYHLGRYRILRKLGEGWFGQSFLAHDQEMVRDVVLKIANDRPLSPSETERFLRDGRVLTELNHPHIAPVFDAGIDETGRRFMVTRPLFGPTLRQRVVADGADLATRLAWFVEVAEALQYAHEQGLLHGDLRPGNVVFTDGDRLLLVDFALAMSDDDFRHMKRSADDLGYLSPEQVAGEDHRVCGASDVFSLGVLLYWLITDRLPFNASIAAPLRHLHAAWDFPEPQEGVPDLPAGLNQVCLRAMARRARDRCATPGLLAEALRRVANDAPSATTTSPQATLDAASGAPPSGLRPWDARDASWFSAPEGDEPSGIPLAVPAGSLDQLEFWIQSLASLDEQEASDISVLFGRGGSGKTSLVQAGILPRLPQHVLPISIVAQGQDTIHSIQLALKAACPELPSGLETRDALALIRHGQAATNWRKVVLVIDQFEACLRESESKWEPLIGALRQADGPRLACLLVTDDRHVSRLQRFLNSLEVAFQVGQNAVAMAPPTTSEARRYLILAAQAAASWPSQEAMFSDTQRTLLDLALPDGRGEQPWTWSELAMLRELLDRDEWRCCPSVAKSDELQRRYLDAVLLMPPANVPRPRRECLVSFVHSLLRDASLEEDCQLFPATQDGANLALTGYREWLEREVGIVRKVRAGAPGSSDQHLDGRFVLAHDFLRDALGDWLLREQLCDWRHRARLLLSAYASDSTKPGEPSRLPGSWDWLRIRLATSPTSWNESEAAVMRQAKRKLMVRLAWAGLIALGCGSVVATLAVVWNG